MILHQRKRPILVSWPKEKRKEPNLLLPENIRQLEKLLRMICSFFKIIFSKSNPQLDKSGPTVKLQLLSPSVLLRLIPMNVLLFATFPVQKKDFPSSLKVKDQVRRLTLLNKKSTLETSLLINLSSSLFRLKIEEKLNVILVLKSHRELLQKCLNFLLNKKLWKQDKVVLLR